MYSCIRPYQFVKEHENDTFFKNNERYYIRTKYAGVVETTKEEYEKYMGREE